jgi:hypothetical protein
LTRVSIDLQKSLWKKSLRKNRTFTDRLRDAGCQTVFLGALATEEPKHLYARLGFHPVMLARAWVRELPKKG